MSNKKRISPAIVGVIFSLVLFAVQSLPLSGAIPAGERAALIALYNSTNGDSWTKKSGWKTAPVAADGFAAAGTEGDWYGVQTGDGKVLQITLGTNNLTGTLPEEIGNLPNLTRLDLIDNKISGSIPSSIGNLSNLTYLCLSANKLTGSIPSTFGNLDKLEILYIGWNELSGSIPPQIGDMARIKEISMDMTQLSGALPPELGNLDTLERLSVGACNLVGTLPPQLANMDNVKEVYLACNQIGGSIPPEFGNFKSLVELHLHTNQLTGSIPPELSNIKTLFHMSLSYNELSGSIPAQLAGMPNIGELGFSYNNLTGSIPKEFGNTSTLIIFAAGHNKLTGTIPPEFANLNKLEILNLGNNLLTGNIPTQFGRLPKLQMLTVSVNKLTGNLPAEIGNITTLEMLLVDGNYFTGPIPPSYANLINLQPYINWTDFGYNALYCEDSGLASFLASRDPDWADTQTIAPTALSTQVVSPNSVKVSWDPILFQSISGGYRVLYSTSPTGPWTFSGMTSSKSHTYYDVTGLLPGTTYYFIVRTQTYSSTINPNTVVSEDSEVVSATTTAPPGTHLLTVQSTPAAGVSISVSPGDYNGSGNGVTQFTRIYNQGTSVTLTAPASFNGGAFLYWTLDSVQSANQTLQVSMDAAHTAVAHYEEVIPAYILTVQSSPDTGANITVSPADNRGNGNGVTGFTREYDENTTVSLQAPATLNGKNFARWTVDGSTFTSTGIQVTMNSAHTATAVYEDPPPGTFNLTVQSSPAAGVEITVSPADSNGSGSGETQFTRTYEQGTTVNLTAPAQFNGNDFVKWTIDGTEFTQTAVQVTMDANKTATAVYEGGDTGEIHTLTIQSTHGQGARITVSPADDNGDTDGNTHFERRFAYGTFVTLTAPSTHNGKNFSHWKVDGQVITASTTLQWTISGDHKAKAYYVTPSSPGLVLSRLKYNFGYRVNGELPASQALRVTINGDAASWTASSDAQWLNISPGSGSGSGSFETAISVDPTGLNPGNYTGRITVSAPAVPHSPQTVEVTLTVFPYNGTSKPAGEFSTPLEGAEVSGSIALTGWVVDDIGVESVKIYVYDNGQPLEIGGAVFVEGARPDVEDAYPNMPGSYQAGWGYMLLTNYLPNGGNGTYVLEVKAKDLEGNTVSLGTRTIIVDNVNTVKPFGAIDSPDQGGTASGEAFINWGWALTPQPNMIPIDGSTITVYLDGFNIGNPKYNIYRGDIARLFPGLANTDGASGYFIIDTTPYLDGIHTIQWTVKDNAGNSDGIGSRFFKIQNSASSRGGAAGKTAAKPAINPNAPIRPGNYFFPAANRLNNLQSVGSGTVEKRFTIREMERLVIQLAPPDTHILRGAYQLNGINRGRLTAMPIGSTLDMRDNTFYWQPGPGFLGEFHLVFILETHEGEILRRNITVTITAPGEIGRIGLIGRIGHIPAGSK